jgi:hypothetical protein
MNKTQGIEIAEQLRNRGFTLSGWARANRFKLRTANDFLCAGLGSKRGGETTGAIRDAFVRDGFIKSHPTNPTAGNQNPLDQTDAA